MKRGAINDVFVFTTIMPKDGKYYFDTELGPVYIIDKEVLDRIDSMKRLAFAKENNYLSIQLIKREDNKIFLIRTLGYTSDMKTVQQLSNNEFEILPLTPNEKEAASTNSTIKDLIPFIRQKQDEYLHYLQQLYPQTPTGQLLKKKWGGPLSYLHRSFFPKSPTSQSPTVQSSTVKSPNSQLFKKKWRVPSISKFKIFKSSGVNSSKSSGVNSSKNKRLGISIGGYKKIKSRKRINKKTKKRNKTRK